MDKLAKDQLKQCVIDLATRFAELGDRNASSVLLILSASLAEGTDEVFASWCVEYAKIRLSAEMDSKTDDENF